MNPLQKLTQDEMHARGVKRSELVRRMGFRNLNKGLRRLDGLLQYLQASDRLLPLLQRALSIPDEKLRIAVAELQEQLVADERARFKPIIQVIPTTIPSPIFVAALIPGLLNIRVPDDLASLPADKEFQVVCDLYRKHRERHSGWAKGKGAVYHRCYDESFELDQDCHLVKINAKHIGLSRAVLRVGGTPLDFHFEEFGAD
ncbi:MAG: hypothetical protein ABFR19_10320 [Pseudomonadota bacterium]